MKHLKENYLTKTYQGQLKPNSEVKQQFQLISKGCNEVYNYFLKKRIKIDKKNQPQPTSQQQQKELTQLKKKQKCKWLNKIPAWTLQEVVKNRLPDAWKKYREYKSINLKAKYPRKKDQWKINLTCDVKTSPKIEKMIRVNGERSENIPLMAC